MQFQNILEALKKNLAADLQLTIAPDKLQSLQAEPLLELGLRLGEGSGAALAVPLLRLACALHGQMATFAEAAVADRPA